MMVGADRTGPVAQVSLQLHQGAITDLLQRLELDPATGRIHGSGQVPRSRPRRAGEITQIDALALQL
jgi:hypothetical protein